MSTANLAPVAQITQLGPRRGNGQEWPDWLRELAFECWALRDAGNCASVRRRLASGELPHPETGEPLAVEIPARTIEHWAADGGWAEERDRRLSELAPAMVRSAYQTLMLTQPEAAQYLRDSITGALAAVCPVCKGSGEVEAGFYKRAPKETACRSCERGVVYPPTDPVRSKNAVAVLDRGGFFSPIGKNDPAARMPQGERAHEPLPDLTGKGPEELAELERQYRARMGASRRQP